MGKYKELLIEREKAKEEEQYPELVMKNEDPIKWEILYTRLIGIVENARETARHISASPVVREMGECIFSLFTPEGDPVCFSRGLMLHVPNQGLTIKWMLMNDYEEDVGIKEGDHFFNNDPYIACTHSPDQTTATPIFYEGELVGWAAGLNHVPETGASESGGVPPSAQTRFEEGIFWPCIKVAENDQLKRDLEMIVERGTRTPLWWLLDGRARLAGIKLIRESVKELISEYGLDYYRRAIYEYIEDTRQASLKLVQNVIFPGRYQAMRSYDCALGRMPVKRPIDALLIIPMEATVAPGGEMEFDFEGASSAGPWAFNSSLPATKGNILNQLIHNLFYSIKYNDGTLQAYKLKVPLSCLNPPSITFPCGLWPAGTLAALDVTECISRGYYAMGFREEVSATGPTNIVMHVAGIDQFGRQTSMSLFQAGYGAMPASAVMDGLDNLYASFNAEADCSDAEMWEKMQALVYLGRRSGPDTGGYGRYRGGNALEELFMVEQVDTFEIGTIGYADHVYPHIGLMGGYPGCANYRYYVTKTNMKELIENRLPLPHSEGEDPANPDFKRLVKGELTLREANMADTEFHRYDLCNMFSSTAGGYGDPIERAPELVKRDLENDLCSWHAAEKVYRVAIDRKTLEIDYEKTKHLRDRAREEREKRGIPAKDYIKGERERIIKGNLPPIPKKCLNDCLKNSEKFLKSFVEFWGLPEDFKQISERK